MEEKNGRIGRVEEGKDGGILVFQSSNLPMLMKIKTSYLIVKLA